MIDIIFLHFMHNINRVRMPADDRFIHSSTYKHSISIIIKSVLTSDFPLCRWILGSAMNIVLCVANIYVLCHWTKLPDKWGVFRLRVDIRQFLLTLPFVFGYFAATDKIIYNTFEICIHEQCSGCGSTLIQQPRYTYRTHKQSIQFGENKAC